MMLIFFVKTDIENVRATEAQAGFRHGIDIQARKC